jgi:hypothetical protein
MSYTGYGLLPKHNETKVNMVEQAAPIKSFLVRFNELYLLPNSPPSFFPAGRIVVERFAQRENRHLCCAKMAAITR